MTDFVFPYTYVEKKISYKKEEERLLSEIKKYECAISEMKNKITMLRIKMERMETIDYSFFSSRELEEEKRRIEELIVIKKETEEIQKREEEERKRLETLPKVQELKEIIRKKNEKKLY